MAKTDLIDIELLSKLLDYNPATGVFTWLPRPRDMFPMEGQWVAWNKRMAGKPAFLAKRGNYHRLRVLKSTYSAHRIAWALHHGAWPNGHVDHINGIHTDNRIENLRDVTHKENCHNLAMKRENKSGAMGVIKRGPSWRAYIWLDGRQKYLGSHRDFDEALRVRREAEQLHGFHQNHGRPRL